jgi:hypothetical protein
VAGIGCPDWTERVLRVETIRRSHIHDIIFFASFIPLVMSWYYFADPQAVVTGSPGNVEAMLAWLAIDFGAGIAHSPLLQGACPSYGVDASQAMLKAPLQKGVVVAYFLISIPVAIAASWFDAGHVRKQAARSGHDWVTILAASAFVPISVLTYWKLDALLVAANLVHCQVTGDALWYWAYFIALPLWFVLLRLALVRSFAGLKA